MYIKKSYYGGVDWSDSKTIITQMDWNHSYDIPQSKAIDCIVKDIISEFPYAETDEIYCAVISGCRYTFPILCNEDGEIKFPVQYQNEWENQDTVEGATVYVSYYFGQAYSYTEYLQEDILQEELCFLIEEQFYACAKGISLIERFYHAPFRELSEAQAYLKTAQKKAENSQFVLLAHSYPKIKNTLWYKKNMEAIHLMTSTPECPFHRDIDVHIRNLKEFRSEDKI